MILFDKGAETAMREVVGRSIADQVLYENKEAISREALKYHSKNRRSVRVGDYRCKSHYPKCSAARGGSSCL